MGFAPHERRVLELGAGLGPVVVRRLEDAGVHSLQALREQGVDPIVERICGALGQPSWANRRTALLRVLSLETDVNAALPARDREPTTHQRGRSPSDPSTR